MPTGVKTTRRVFVAGASASLGLSSARGFVNVKIKPQQPNIIFIMADDLGYTGADLPDHFGINNPKMIGGLAPAPHLPD